MKQSVRLIAYGFIASVIVTPPLYADVFSNTVPVDLVEPAGLYQLQNPDVILMTAKTVIGNGDVCEAVNDYANCTLADVKNDLDPDDNFKPEIKVLLTTNDLSPDGKVSNASLRIRGHSSRSAPQKSFRIKLDSKKNLWRGERRIQLIKSVYDFARIRNALSYELLTSIPALPSLRTQFVNLYIDDNGSSTDYGLFTHVEHVGKEFMVNRGWDKDSAVYKAEDFLYELAPELALDEKGKPVDENSFEKILEIKRGKDHTKLREMLAALNNPNIDFNTQFMGKYFHLENYLSWLSFNILINNADTVDQNYYLYNPKGKDVFYLMSWDNDYAWGANIDDPKSNPELQPRWWYSAANWWDVKLHRRFLQQEGNLALLKTAVTEMRNKYLTSAKIEAITDKYYPVVFPLATRNPDLKGLYVEGDTTAEKQADYTKLFNRLKNNVEQNYSLFMKYADDPMTFYLDEDIKLKDNKIDFGWEESISLLGQNIAYDLEVATEPTFEPADTVQRITDIANNQYKLNWSHPAGTYYYRVIARDTQNPDLHWQVAENYFEDIVHPETGEPIRGVVKFITTVDGVGAINNKPTAQNSAVSVKQNIAKAITLNVSDPDGDALNVTITTAPTHGTLSSQGGIKFQYTPDSNYLGSDSFAYKATDGKLFSHIATVSLNITSASTVNSAPVADNKTVRSSRGKSVVIVATATDADAADSLGFSLSSSPSNGTVTVHGALFTYTPNASFSGEDSFKYVANDGKNDSRSATVTVQVSQSSSTSVASSKKGGGAVSWIYLIMFASFIAIRRRCLHKGHFDK